MRRTHNQEINYNYHLLQKMKKQMLEEKKKTVNRIRLFKKTSEKMFKQKEKQKELQNKKETIKNDMFFLKLRQRSTERLQEVMSQNKRKRNHKCLKSMGDFNLVREPQANMSLYLKVQTRRDDRKRNEILIKKLKEKEQRKKLKSANTVRQSKQKMKLTRQMFFQNKIDTVRAQVNDKIQKQQKQYSQMFYKLRHLKSQQSRALKEWKNTYQILNI